MYMYACWIYADTYLFIHLYIYIYVHTHTHTSSFSVSYTILWADTPVYPICSSESGAKLCGPTRKHTRTHTHTITHTHTRTHVHMRTRTHVHVFAFGKQPSNRPAENTVGPSSLAHSWAEQFTTWPLNHCCHICCAQVAVKIENIKFLERNRRDKNKLKTHCKTFIKKERKIIIMLVWVQECEPTCQLVECARRVVLSGGVPLVGPQEELRGPSGYTPRGFTSSQSGRRSKDFRVGLEVERTGTGTRKKPINKTKLFLFTVLVYRRIPYQNKS